MCVYVGIIYVVCVYTWGCFRFVHCIMFAPLLAVKGPPPFLPGDHHITCVYYTICVCMCVCQNSCHAKSELCNSTTVYLWDALSC